MITETNFISSKIATVNKLAGKKELLGPEERALASQYKTYSEQSNRFLNNFMVFSRIRFSQELMWENTKTNKV